MRVLTLILICFFLGTSQYVYADKKKDIPKVKEYKPTIQLNGYNSNTSFNRPWEDEIDALNGELY